jgi:heavy metal sensor kinase
VKNKSIGFRLAAWYSGVFACGLAAFSIAAWFAMRASVYHAIDDELRDRVQGVARFMENQIASLSLPEIRDEFREHSVLGPGGDLFQVCDERGQWLYRSVPLENASVAIRLPGALPAPAFADTQIDRHRLRFYSQRITVNGKAYTVQVASVMNEAYEALERFRLILLLATPLLLIASSAGGYWLSTRALAPVDDISQAAKRISIESLDDRLAVPRTGDQLQRLSETLNAMLSRLSSSVRRMKQFTADASHELRAPIALIRTTAEVAVQKRDRAAGEYLQALDEILEETERTSQAVDSLMLLARADSGSELIEATDIDFSALVHSAAEQGEKLARSRGLTFFSQIAESPLWIHGDAAALRRAVLILMDNAAKYTPSGGSMTLRLEERDGFAAVSVSDTGIGIAEEDMTHIFDRFWRADKARSREQGGAGLGLSIAKWIVEMHRGRIEVKSAPGEGSTFCLRVPLRQTSDSTRTIRL